MLKLAVEPTLNWSLKAQKMFVLNSWLHHTIRLCATFFGVHHRLTSSGKSFMVINNTLSNHFHVNIFLVPLEFPILKRERFNRWYSSTAFFSAFIIIDLPIIFLCSLTYVSITYAMTNQPPELHRFLLFFVISLALNYASQGIGLVGSALLDVKVRKEKIILGNLNGDPFLPPSLSPFAPIDAKPYFFTHVPLP